MRAGCGGDDADGFHGKAEGEGDEAAFFVGPLAGDLDGEESSIPLGDAGLDVEEGVIDGLGEEGFADDDVAGGQCRVGVTFADALAAHDVAVGMQAGGIFGEGVVKVGDDGEVFVLDLDGFYAAIGGVFIFCKDDCNGVSAIEHFVFGEDGMIAMDEPLAVCAGHVLGGVGGDDAGAL